MTHRAYDCLDVANYIVNYSIDSGKPISNLKLQKILYYVQAASLVENDMPMFNDEICAWTYGPVVKSVYHEFKSYANAAIEDYVNEKYTDYGLTYDPEYNPNEIISDNDKKIINRVVSRYQDTSPLEMVRKTHREEPWKSAYEKHNSVIKGDVIKSFYSKNPELI